LEYSVSDLLFSSENMGFYAVDRDFHDGSDLLIGPFFSIEKMECCSIVMVDGCHDALDDLFCFPLLKVAGCIFFPRCNRNSLNDLLILFPSFQKIHCLSIADLKEPGRKFGSSFERSDRSISFKERVLAEFFGIICVFYDPEQKTEQRILIFLYDPGKKVIITLLDLQDQISVDLFHHIQT
jgi:hypothetical protein